jgi:lysyl-tRNA synthetase class 2
MFLDIERDTQRLQVMVELNKLTSQNDQNGFKSFKKIARIGDWICKSMPLHYTVK